MDDECRPSGGIIAECEGGDLNPYGSYPASTSMPETASPDTHFSGDLGTGEYPDAQKSTPSGEVPPPERPLPQPYYPARELTLLRREAAALLELASQQQPIDGDRARRFARAVIESFPITKLAKEVLDGGLFAGMRLVELAGAVVATDSKKEREQEGGGGAG
jgi:hypothetical protein